MNNKKYCITNPEQHIMNHEFRPDTKPLHIMGANTKQLANNSNKNSRTVTLEWTEAKTSWELRISYKTNFHSTFTVVVKCIYYFAVLKVS